MNLSSPPETSRKMEIKLRVTDLFEVATLHLGLATIGNKSVRHFWMLNRLPRWNPESRSRKSLLQLNRCVSLRNSSLGCLLMIHCCAHSPNHFLHPLFALRFPARLAPPHSGCVTTVGGVCLILPAQLPRPRFDLLIKPQLQRYF